MNLPAWNFYGRFYRGSLRVLLFSVMLSILQSSVVLPIALIVRKIFDSAIPKKDFSQLLLLSVFALILYLLEGGLTLWTRSLSLKTTKIAIQRIQDEIIKKIYLLPRSYYTNADRMKLHARIVQDTFRVDVMSNALVAQLIPALFVSLGLLAVLAYLNVFLSLLMLLAVPALILSQLLGRALKRKIRTYHQLFETFSKRIMVILSAIDLTRIRGAEEFEISKQRDVHDELRRISGSQAWFNAVYQIAHKTLIASFGIVVLVVGGKFVLDGTMTWGELFSFVAAAGLLKSYLFTISSVIPQIIEGTESLSVLHEFDQLKLRLPYSGKKKADFSGKMAFESVDFRYEDRPVLKKISFTIRPHEVAGIVGPNGSGKTTMTHLMLGFYRPQNGRLTADDIPYDDWDMAHLRRFFGVVQQDPIFIPDTVFRNIAYGAPDISRDRVLEAAESALCLEFIRKLPGGFETPIEGINPFLSGGELQKIAIARALTGDPRLLILDEPTNNLDALSVKKILTNIKKMKIKPAVILISHSPDVLREADDVMVLDEGRLVDKGLPEFILETYVFHSRSGKPSD